MTPLPNKSHALTLLNLATARAQTFCTALGLEDRAAELVSLCERFLEPWGRRPLVRVPSWRSTVVDDGTPFEFSVAYGSPIELRFMAEPLGISPSLAANTSAARVLLASLARDYDLDLTRFERIADLFLPPAPSGSFSIWLAAGFSKNRATEFKLYLNPQARGAAAAPQVLEEALVRLGFDSAWTVVGNVLARRGPKLDELKYFSLDLTPSPEARVKVYARHLASSPEIVAAAASGCPSAHPGEVQRFLRTAAPHASDYTGRGPFTCYSFVQSSGSVPHSVTTHFPINGYADSDQHIQERVRACHDMLSIPSVEYLRTVAQLERPLDGGVGQQSYVSFRRYAGRARLTVYFPAEAYVPGTVEDPNVARKQSGVMQSANPLVRRQFARHPLFGRLRREDPNATHLWLIAENIEIGLASAAKALKQSLAQLDDADLSMLLLALNESEDGDGLRGPHSSWLESVRESLSDWQPAPLSPQLFEPGQRLRQTLQTPPGAQPYARFGMALGTIVSSLDLCGTFAVELSRHAEVQAGLTEALPSLPRLFETPTSLAACLPAEGQAEFYDGVAAWVNAAWTLLNDLYGVCYGAK